MGTFCSPSKAQSSLAYVSILFFSCDIYKHFTVNKLPPTHTHTTHPPISTLPPTRHNHTQEGFIEFADALRRRRDKYNRGQDPAESVWHHAITMGTAVGAIGLGALAAFTLRQAFSWTLGNVVLEERTRLLCGLLVETRDGGISHAVALLPMFAETRFSNFCIYLVACFNFFFYFMSSKSSCIYHLSPIIDTVLAVSMCLYAR